MTAALQQQVFALDARYNAHRAPQSPNFRILYIRRRSQLLRETSRSSESWRQYIRLRSLLLQHRYGPPKLELSVPLTRISSSSSIVSPRGSVIPTKEAEASRAIVGGNTIGENYAFVGVQHIFDQHTEAVTMVKFANNDKSRLCCSSLDHTLSICNVASTPEVTVVLRGHKKAVPEFDWSTDNDSIVSCSLDGTIKVWKVEDGICLRTINDPSYGQILCCIFHSGNNNLVLTGNNRGELRIANISTGRFLSHNCRVGGSIHSIASDTNGRIFWVGNNQGEIISIFCEINGCLTKMRKISLSPHCRVTNLSYRAWINREGRNPLLLVNATDNSMYIFSVTNYEGGLQIKRKFQNRHQTHIVRSTFCPIMSFRQGSVVVTGSEDGSIYFVDIEKTGNKAVVNALQGHSSAVLGISFNYDESLLATSDIQGLVIIWKKGNIE